jgi:RNA polymerase nonessential primary-like sigma factor
MIQLYYRDISKYKSPTEEQERQLVMLTKQCDEQARQTLIESYLLLVTKIAQQYRRPSTELLDLIQEGNIGLIDAVDRFDPEMGVRFSTFAT